jgi:hypothetical protein
MKNTKNNRLRNHLDTTYAYPHINQKIIFDSDNKCTNAFLLCTHPDILKMAYGKIKSKPGNMVHGSDRETLDGISEN